MAQSGNSTAYFTSKSPTIWIIDTGLSYHITGNKGILHDLSSTLSLPIETLANGIISRVKNVGTAKITSSLLLSFVFYVHSVPFTLLFINEFTRSLIFSMTFFPDYYVFQEIGTKRIVGIGREFGSQYHQETGTD